MTYIIDSIVGPYPFLLIAQILIVSALMLSLIWIFIQKAQQAGSENEGQSSEVASLPSSASVLPQAIASPLPDVIVPSVSEGGTRPQANAAPEVPAAAPPASLDNTEALAAASEAEGLKDKVRYLESRLMEYEIVQEEISNLGALRSENEKLKEELLRLSASATAEPSVGEPVQTVSSPNEVLESVSKAQIDTILDKLDKITQKD